MRPRCEESALSAWHSVKRAVAKARRTLRRELQEYGLTPGQARLMHLVGEAEPDGIKLNELSKKTFVTTANITKLMDRLQEAGYVRREADPSDRRVLLAKLTPEGRQLLAKVVPTYRAWAVRLMSCLAAEEQAELTSLLTRLAVHAAAMAESEDSETPEAVTS